MDKLISSATVIFFPELEYSKTSQDRCDAVDTVHICLERCNLTQLKELFNACCQIDIADVYCFEFEIANNFTFVFAFFAYEWDEIVFPILEEKRKASISKLFMSPQEVEAYHIQKEAARIERREENKILFEETRLRIEKWKKKRAQLECLDPDDFFNSI